MAILNLLDSPLIEMGSNKEPKNNDRQGLLAMLRAKGPGDVKPTAIVSRKKNSDNRSQIISTALKVLRA